MDDQKIKIAVLDTNIFQEHSMLADSNIEKKDILYTGNNKEDCGHGTAVCSIILKECPRVDLTVFPIFEGSTDLIDIEKLQKVLEHIGNDDITYDVINLSSGVVELEDPGKLFEICRKITGKGTIIVAAYDNSGIMTYPACFPNVIGVDTNYRINQSREYEFVENSPINIRGYQRQQRVAWDKPSYIFTRGSSFVVPYITGVIANTLLEGKSGVKDVMAELKAGASINTTMSLPVQAENGLRIEKAIVFPFNKEIHSIVKFCEELTFELKGIYDLKYFMRIGKKASSVIKQPLNIEYTIKSIEKINWEDDFDTVIIGHLHEVISIAGSEFLDQLIDKIIKHKKNIYAFDDYIYNKYFSGKDNLPSRCFYPSINKHSVPSNLFGKMWVASSPVLAIMGTRSQQGKFTLQMALKKQLVKRGFDIKHLASEPTGWLFGADAVFPFGYANTIGIDHRDTVLTLNNMVHDIEDGKVDLVLAGCQSGTIPFNCYSGQMIMLAQTAFLYGTIPDAVFLCVSPDDELDYIKRTIAYIEASVDTKVIGIFLFPVLTEIHTGYLMKSTNISGSDRIKEIATGFENTFNIPVVEFNDEGIDKQIENLVGFFN